MDVFIRNRYGLLLLILVIHLNLISFFFTLERLKKEATSSVNKVTDALIDILNFRLVFLVILFIYLFSFLVFYDCEFNFLFLSFR